MDEYIGYLRHLLHEMIFEVVSNVVAFFYCDASIYRKVQVHIVRCKSTWKCKPDLRT